MDRQTDVTSFVSGHRPSNTHATLRDCDVERALYSKLKTQEHRFCVYNFKTY